MSKTYFISGHADYDVKEFIRDYVPLIATAIEEGATFLVGDGVGVPAFAQSFLKQNLKEDDHSKVKVFHKGEDAVNYLSLGFLSVGGFVSDEEANVAMTLCSDEDIVCLKPNRSNSLTAKNVLRRYTPQFDFNEWATACNRHVAFWNIVMSDEQPEVEKTEDQE